MSLPFLPFPKNSIISFHAHNENQITKFLTNLINNHSTYLESPMERIIIIKNDDSRYNIVPSPDIYVPIETVSIKDFNIKLLQSGDFVIVDCFDGDVESLIVSLYCISVRKLSLSSLFYAAEINAIDFCSLGRVITHLFYTESAHGETFDFYKMSVGIVKQRSRHSLDDFK